MNTFKVDKRDFSQSAKKLRRAGIVPGTVFGGGLPETISLQMDAAAAKKLITSKRVGSQLTLELEGKMIPVQLKVKETDPLTGTILHVDFQALASDQKINSVIHILVKNADKLTAVLQHHLMEIPYASLPEDMIDTITIDVDGMPVGTAITVADIPELQSDKIELQVPADELVMRIA